MPRTRKSPGKPDAADAKFVFKGTILKAGASTLAQVPKGARTAIVRVDDIEQAPPALAKTLGREITVKLGGGDRPKPGDELLFHANSWLFGDSVAVESVKQEKAAPSTTMLAAGHADPTRNLANRQLQDRVSNAAMVIEGEVSSVHLPESESFAALSARPSAAPLSEHDPKWREAVVDVGAVHKGDPATKKVVIRFPSSMDVQWYRAPKFHTGDRGVWMLQPAQGAAPPAAETAGVARKAKRGKTEVGKMMAATALPGAAVYTALHPMDFQPANQLDSVAPAIRAAIATGNK